MNLLRRATMAANTLQEELTTYLQDMYALENQLVEE
jgi:hypothetical protein